MGFIYLWIQHGVVQLDFYTVGEVIALSIFLLVVPDIIEPHIKLKSNFFTLSSLTFTLILLLALLGFVCKMLVISMAKPILVVFIVALVLYFLRIRSSLKSTVIAVIMGGFFGLILGFFIWGIDFLSPIFLEKILCLGKVSTDSLMHISLANIFNTYNVPSTGLDGIPYVSYHWGSHVLLASLSNLIRIDLVTFYNLAYPIIFIPLYFKSIMLLVQSLRQLKNFSNEINWFFFLLLIVFHFRIFYNPQLGLLPLAPFNSEPYLIGIIFTFLIIDLIINDIYNNRTISKISLIIIPYGIFLISSMKISLGFLFIAAVFYLLFRYKYFKKWNYWPYFILLAAIFILSYEIFTTTANEKFSILRPLGIIRWLGIYYIPYYLFLILLIFLILIFDLKDDFKRKIISGKYSDLEVLVFIAVIGLIPGMVWNMYGNRHYFSDFQYWLSMVLFLAYIPYIREKIYLLFQDNRSYKILKIFIILLFANIIIRTVNYSSQNFMAILKDKKEIYASEKMNSFNETDSQFLKNLKELSLLPINEKAQSCVYVNNTDSLLKNIPQNLRFSFAFLVPAITGICSIDGISPDRSRKDFTFSFYNYKKSESRKEVIEKAHQFGFKKMFDINIDLLNKKSYITTILLK